MPFTTESTCQTFVNNLFEAPAGQNVGLTGYVCVGDGVDNKVGQYCIIFISEGDLELILDLCHTYCQKSHLLSLRHSVRHGRF